MADLIELDLVVRDKGLKQSLTTVERLERQIVKAAKAVDQNRISQDRYNKVLLQAKREYQALGVSSQKATAEIRRFAAAQSGAAQTTNSLTGALKQQSVAQMAATKNSNRMGVVTQQAGYQVSDFIVQVQGGTNAFVAFGQQASQLVGVLPLVAGRLGLTAGAAIGLSAGLGIAIPLVTAVGAALSRSAESAKDAAQDVTSFKDAIAGLRSELELLQSGAESREVLQLNKEIAAVENQIYDIKNRTLDLSYADAETKKLILESAKSNSEATNQELKTLQAQLTELKMKKQAIEINKNLAGSEAQEQENIRANQQRANRERIAAEREFQDLVDKTRISMGEVSSETTTVTQKTLDLTSELGGSVEEAIALQKALDTGKISASQLSGVDIKAGISPAVAAAQELAKQLGISLRTALAMSGMIKKAGPVLDPRDPAYDADEANLQRLKDMVESGELYNSTLEKVTKTTKKLGSTTKKTMSDAEKAAEAYAKALDDQVIGAIGGVADAWGDFVVRGFNDFKGFVSSVLNSFKSMIANMIAIAAKNKIMLSLGIGGVPTSAIAGAGMSGGSLLGMAGGGLSGLAGSGGIMGAVGGVASGLGGILSGGGLGASFANLGGLLSGSVGGLGAIGAAIPALGLVVLGFSALIGKTKELDNGLKVTVGNMDALVETFSVIQKKRLFGLIKSTRTNQQEAGSEISDPIIQAVQDIQQGVMDAASAFGIASDAFESFAYDMEISLKGLSEEEKLAKINEELGKMGDSFASLTGIFDNMNDLLAVAQQRFDLETQLLQMQGDIVELRRMEIEAVHVLNRDLATRIQLLQAESDLQGALGAFAAGITEQQSLIRRAVDALVAPLVEAINRTKTQAEKSYQTFRNAADKTRDEAENIVDIITGALESRTIQSEAVERMRYTQAQQQLASFAGGASFDEASLRRATEGVSVDSTKFFGSFEDYARDFYKTQISLTKLADKAQGELTDVEKQIDVAEKAYQVAMGTYQETVDLNTAIETLAEDLNVYEATKLANEPLIKMVQDEGNRQIELLDSLLVETTKQVNALLGIETSMADLVGASVSIGEAMGVLGLGTDSLAGGVLALDAIEKDINGNVTDLGLYVVDLNGSVLKLDTGVFSLTDTVDALDGDITTLFESINLLDGGIDDFGLKVNELGVSTDDLGIDIGNLGTTLADAMSGLGSIISGLSGAISGLAASNNALAAAQKAQADADAAVAKALKDAQDAAAAAIVQESTSVTSSLPKLSASDISYKSTSEADFYRVAGRNFSTQSEALGYIAGQNKIRGYATGGMHSGGMRLVGENGPELEVTGPSRIYSAQQTKSLMSGGSGEVVSELRNLRREVSEMKAEQRKIGVENVKYNKKSYDLNREWDIVGLPATRTS